MTESAALEVKDMLQQNDMPDGYLKESKWWWLCWPNCGASAEEEPITMKYSILWLERQLMLSTINQYQMVR